MLTIVWRLSITGIILGMAIVNIGAFHQRDREIDRLRQGQAIHTDIFNLILPALRELDLKIKGLHPEPRPYGRRTPETSI